MVLLPIHQQVSDPATLETARILDEFISRRCRLGLIVDDGPDSEEARRLVETLENDLGARGGQCLTLDAFDLSNASLAERLLAVLDAWRNGRPFRINLPDILRHNPNSGSPFINRAILWQRLGDRLIEEEEPARETVLILKNVDALDAKGQHDLARLIRFHAVHRIRRTFMLTLRAENLSLLQPELRRLVDEQFDV